VRRELQVSVSVHILRNFHYSTFGDDVFADARPQDGFSVCESGIRCPSGTLDLNLVTDTRPWVGALEKADRSLISFSLGKVTHEISTHTISELPCP
jgi:hypothetical protein